MLSIHSYSHILSSMILLYFVGLFVSFRFMCCAHLRKVLSKYLFLVFCLYSPYAVTGHWLTPWSSCDTVWYRILHWAVCTDDTEKNSDKKKSCQRSLNTTGHKRQLAKGFVGWLEKNTKIEIIQETNTAFKDHLLITTAYLSQLPSFIILIGHPNCSKRM